MSKTPDVDRTIAINKNEAAANQHAGDVAKAQWEAGFRKAERDDNATKIHQGELDREGSIVERQQTNKIENPRSRGRGR